MSASGSLIGPASAQCLACGKKYGVLASLPLCNDCALALLRARTETRGGRICPRCLSHLKNGVCPVCARDKEGLIQRAFAPYAYRGVVRALIHKLKFQGETRAAALLAPAMRDAIGLFTPDVIVPVPLHPAREHERGYNQAALLARVAAAPLGIPVENALTRVKSTRRQSSLHDANARRENVEKAFNLSAAASLAGKTVLLVDDVRTSGATALACARALKGGGARAVYLLTAAVTSGYPKKWRTIKRRRFL